MTAVDLRAKDLLFFVQYRRKHGADVWRTVAGFDVAGAAETYYAQQESEVWEYRLVTRPLA